jgi:hypothetical protein
MRVCSKCEENPIAHFESRTCWTCYHIDQVVRDKKDTSIQLGERTKTPKTPPQEVAPPDPWSTHPKHPF